MHIGRLDRKITIEQSTPTRNSSGEAVDSWSTFATVWAQKQDLRGQEFFAARQVNSEVITKFKIRHLSGVTRAMRVNYGGSYYRIEQIVELGRNEAMELITAAQVD
jgi:SPP1 family predicted phage head-tail adaptor